MELFKHNNVSIFSNYLDNLFIYFLKSNFLFYFYYSQLDIQSVLTPQLEEKNDYDQIMQEWLISTEIGVDEQELVEPEAEEASANSEAQPSSKLSEKLAANMEKLEVNVEKLISDIAEIKQTN